VSFNWAPAISKAIATAVLAGRRPDGLVLNPAIFDDLMTRLPKVHLLNFDIAIDRPTFDGVPIVLDARCETYKLI
jgi:hypothetical protein